MVALSIEVPHTAAHIKVSVPATPTSHLQQHERLLLPVADRRRAGVQPVAERLLEHIIPQEHDVRVQPFLCVATNTSRSCTLTQRRADGSPVHMPSAMV